MVNIRISFNDNHDIAVNLTKEIVENLITWAETGARPTFKFNYNDQTYIVFRQNIKYISLHDIKK